MNPFYFEEIAATPGLAQHVVCSGRVDDYLEYARHGKEASVNAGRLNSCLEYGDDWLGLPKSEVLTMNGYDKGLELAERYRRQLPELRASVIRRQRVWSDDGDEFDRDRMEAGRDDYWRSSRRRTRVVANPILKLTCEIGGSASLTALQLAWGGAVAFAVCDAAEGAGYRIEIEAIYCGDVYESGPSLAVYRAICKGASEPLDRRLAIVGLACPAFFRVHVHNSMLARDHRVQAGYSRPRSVPLAYQGELHIRRCSDADDAAQVCQLLMARIAEMSEAA